jgi:excinuclease UvrABC nuclease subunit
MLFMQLGQLTKLKLPDTPGVYFFRQKGKILYIGKATSLKDRVRSYFSKDLIETRGPHMVDMVFKADTVTHEATDSVLEALILEANLIKKHQPKYNTKEKDNKSFNYVVITHDILPQVLLVRGRNLAVKAELEKINAKHVYGPYPSGGAIREGLKIIRRIFPFIDASSVKKDNYEFYRQLGLSPDVKQENVSSAYAENIKNIELFFAGKKKKIVTELKKRMMLHAKHHEFERAGEVKRQIFALEHINDIALIKDDTLTSPTNGVFRIEAYDVAHMSGKNMVGVMTVVIDGRAQPNEYRKFIIRTQTGSNDTGALEEILSRRFRHTEWGVPDIVLTDGGVAQMNVAEQVLKRYQMPIPVLSVLKDERHKPKDVLGDAQLAKKYRAALLLANSEAHRFSITFHKKKRAESFLKTGKPARKAV